MGKVISRERKNLLLCIGVTLLWMGLIYCFSAQNASESSSLSGNLLRKLLVVFVPHWAEKTAAEQRAVMDGLHTIFRKLGHFSEYAVLGALLTLTLHCVTALMKKSRRATLFWGYILPALLALCYAISDEFHQKFVAGRSCELRDVMIDFCGALLSIMLIRAFSRYARKKKKRKRNRKQPKKRPAAQR